MLTNKLQSHILLIGLQKRFLELEKLRVKQESLFCNNQLLFRDICEIYAALFINAITSFESFIEEMFFCLLTGKIKLSNSVRPKVAITNRNIAREIILQGRNYIDWLPYERTEKIAMSFFKDGKPFTVLDKNEKNHIDKCLFIRNALAHHSDHSIEKYKKKVLSNLSINPRERAPKKFLRVEFSKYPKKTYYEQYISELFRISCKICIES